jgi:hypothetical protein
VEENSVAIARFEAILDLRDLGANGELHHEVVGREARRLLALSKAERQCQDDVSLRKFGYSLFGRRGTRRNA